MRALILRVDEEGVEYLPSLSTHSLEAVEVPEAVVKEWGRRKGAAAAVAEHARQLELAGVVLETAGVELPSSDGRRGSSAARTLSRLGHSLRRIKKMAPLDRHGMWLLKNLLTQTRPEDQEELCRSIQDKLSKRKGALTRSKDRLRLECDQRCVFTKAANEIRTSSEMTCESNRGNVLSIMVKDHQHARRQMERKRLQQQGLGRTSSAVASSVPPPTSASPGRRGPKDRISARETERPKGETGAAAKERENLKTQSQDLEPLPSLPPPPLVISTKMATMPLSGVFVATSSSQPDRENSTAVPASFSRKRRRGAQNAPPVRQRGDVQKVSPLAGHSRLPRSSSVQAKGAPSPSDSAASGAGACGAVRGVRRLGLPPLEERYPNAKGSWVCSPVELRLQRPRCKSVDVAHLDQPAYKEYMKRVLRVGAAGAAAATRQESIGAETNGQEQRVTGCGGGSGNRLGSNLTKSSLRDRTAARSFRGSSSCPPVQEEEAQDGGGGGCNGGHGGNGETGNNSGHCASFLSLVSQIPPPGGGQAKNSGGPRSTGKGSTATAAAAALLSNGDGHRRVDGNGRCRARNGRHDPLKSAYATPPALVHTLSRFQLRDVEEALRPTANGGGGGGCGGRGGGEANSAKTRQETVSQFSTSFSGHDDSSSAASPTVDDALASEALRLRSKGARKVLKNTQRLLGALRTPASSCQTTSTGSRRGGGGGSVGGHSSVVVHRRGGAGDAAIGGGGGGHSSSSSSSPNLGKFPSRDDEVWRAARGTRPARLAEVLRCVVPPHIVRIECEILLHESLNRTGGGRDGDGGVGGGHNNGTWDDFVFAWECLGDGILAGRALSNLWEHAHQDLGGTNDASRSEWAADDLLSDGLRRALLATHAYRPPGVDQLFGEWLDELLEVVRAHVRRACSRVPIQHGLTAGLGWFKEVCSDERFLHPARTHGDF